MGKENESKSCEQKEPSETKSREETALSQREMFPEDESKYTTTILAPGREAERGRSKFEELQAASRNLERRLHEDDDYRRRQEIERRMNKDKPARYFAEASRESNYFSVSSLDRRAILRFSPRFSSLSLLRARARRWRRERKSVGNPERPHGGRRRVYLNTLTAALISADYLTLNFELKLSKVL